MVCHNEAQLPAKRSSAMRTKIQKVEDNETCFRAATRNQVLLAFLLSEFFFKNLLSEPLYWIESSNGRTKLRIALTMAYVFPRWAVKAVFNKCVLAQFGLAGRWNTCTKRVRTT